MRRFLSLACLLVSPGLIFGQQVDRHFAAPRVAPLVHRSTFVHGYLHGYEEGFHQADFDLQMGRIARGESNRKNKPAGYEREFGSKHMYEAGFRRGFDVGYADGASGRSFRAVDNIVSVGAMDASANSTVFDEGVQAGYNAGQHNGLDDARAQRPANPSPTCPSSPRGTQQEFCGAYARGFEMGYSDGYVNQAKPTTEAKKE